MISFLKGETVNKKLFFRGLLLLLFSAQISFGGNFGQLQQNLTTLQTQLTQLESSLSALRPTKEPRAQEVPKAIIRVEVMANAFTYGSDKLPRFDQMVSNSKKYYEDILRQSGVYEGFENQVNTRVPYIKDDTKKPHLTIVEFDVPVYGNQNAEVMRNQIRVFLQQESTKAQMGFTQQKLSQPINFEFKQLGFLADSFLVFLFNPSAQAVQLRKKIIEVLQGQYPRGALPFPVWEPHISLYQIKEDPEGNPVLSVEQDLKPKLQSLTNLKSFAIANANQFRLNARILVKQKVVAEAKQKFLSQ